MKSIKYVNHKTLSPATKNGEYKLNDIVEVIEDDNNKYYYVYLNNAPYYIRVPADVILLSQIKNITWTKELKTNVIKSCSVTEIYFSEITKRFNYTYTLVKGTIKDMNLS